MLQKYLKEKKKAVEDNLMELLGNYRNKYPEKLAKAMEYAVMNGGKRIRPILMYMICDLFDENKKSYDKIKEIAVALEFIHCYSLVHDDLPAMDNDDYRRGKLTVHKKYNEAIGVLVGDVLLTEAFNIISSSTKISDENKVAIILKLSEYAGFYGMVGGQYKDVESEKILNLDTEKNIKKHLKKLAEAGTQIRIMIENQKYQQYQNTFKQLQKEYAETPNIVIKSDQHMKTMYLHSKITLMDKSFWIQSSNLTHSTFAKNREHLFRSENPKILKNLTQLFEKDRSGKMLFRSDLHPNLVVCNINCREVITHLLS